MWDAGYGRFCVPRAARMGGLGIPCGVRVGVWAQEGSNLRTSRM